MPEASVTITNMKFVCQYKIIIFKNLFEKNQYRNLINYLNQFKELKLSGHKSYDFAFVRIAIFQNMKSQPNGHKC